MWKKKKDEFQALFICVNHTLVTVITDYGKPLNIQRTWPSVSSKCCYRCSSGRVDSLHHCNLSTLVTLFIGGHSTGTTINKAMGKVGTRITHTFTLHTLWHRNNISRTMLLLCKHTLHTPSPERQCRLFQVSILRASAPWFMMVGGLYHEYWLLTGPGLHMVPKYTLTHTIHGYYSDTLLFLFACTCSEHHLDPKALGKKVMWSKKKNAVLLCCFFFYVDDMHGNLFWRVGMWIP